MLIKGMTRKRITEIAGEYDLWPQWTSMQWASFALRPKGERFREIVEADADYPELYVVCQHGHEAFIKRVLEEGASVMTTMRNYDPAVLERWEEVQAPIRAEHAERYGAPECNCEGDQ